jgi:Ca2+-transporting ATPase
LIALQILWINLVSDSFPSLALITEKEENVMGSKPRREKSILSGIWSYIIVAGILGFIVKLSSYLISMNQGNPIELTRTIVLTTAIFYELFFVYTVRSSLPLSKIGIFSNKWINYATLFSMGLQFIILYTPLGSFFEIVPLSLNDWFLVLPLAISGVLIFEIGKYIKLKRNK